jgi:hypothetical protein
MMPGEPDDDEYGRQQRLIAEELERARPSWIVLFGGYSRGFWAFPLFGPGGAYFAHRDPRELERRMIEAELEYENATRAR